MGSINSRERNASTDSKRLSQRTSKENYEKQENPKKLDASELKFHQRLQEKKKNMEQYLNNLQDKISRHGDNLDRLLKAKNALVEKSDEVVKILNGNSFYKLIKKICLQRKRQCPLKPAIVITEIHIPEHYAVQETLDNVNKNDAEASPEQMIDVQTDTIKKAVDILEDVQKKICMNINPLENSFKEVRRDIDMCRYRFGKEFTFMQPPATVQLFYIHGGSAIKQVEEELITTLKHKLGRMNFVNCQSVSDIDEKKLLIVLCVEMTRLHADAANAIKDIKNPGNAALLIIHYTETHSVTNQKSSIHLTDQEFKNLRCIFDMTFMSGNGFLQCNMNERSIKEICSFCKQQPLGVRL